MQYNAIPRFPFDDFSGAFVQLTDETFDVRLFCNRLIMKNDLQTITTTTQTSATTQGLHV